jgi:hypothetical protein
MSKIGGKRGKLNYNLAFFEGAFFEKAAPSPPKKLPKKGRG